MVASKPLLIAAFFLFIVVKLVQLMGLYSEIDGTNYFSSAKIKKF